MEAVHKPVMLQEILDFFRQTKAENPVFLDMTAGEGGHSLAILETFPGSKLWMIDRDEVMLGRATARVEKYSERVTPRNINFSELKDNIGDIRFGGIVADLGISMFHYTGRGRGFSFKMDEPLDMRLDNSSSLTAADIVNRYGVKEMEKIFYEYGEERWTKKIVEKIVETRKRKPFNTSSQLADFIAGVIPRKFWPPGRHPAFRIFQALRIMVNDELGHIERGIIPAAQFLESGGVMCVISFHSLEDRIVKNKMRDLARERKGEFELLTKKPLLPGAEEISDNPASRSAKLRVIRKI